MSENPGRTGAHATPAPSPWVIQHLPPARGGDAALDVACGSGRHLLLALERGYAVTGVDRDTVRASQVAVAGHKPFRLVTADLEDGSFWPLPGEKFAAVIVTNYLHRPVLPDVIAAVAPGGLLIYETFAQGNERYGRPSNPAFLLAEGELLRAVEGRLTPVAFEQATLSDPARVVQRICARA